MGYYLEVWLRGFAKDFLRGLSTKERESYHPHITLVRPFQVTAPEERVQEKVVAFCKDRQPLPFSLEGKGTFDGAIHYVPVTNSAALLQFNDGLEELLAGEVQFVQKLNDEKILHATVDTAVEVPPCPRIDQYMLRLTGIKDKRVWFSYDFVTQTVLTRAESLEKRRWYETVHRFSAEHGLLPTRQGYQPIGKR